MEDITVRRELERQKETLLGMVSHELKTPLTAVKGFVQLLERRVSKAGDEQTAGGDAVRDLQLYLNPCAEHVLDWFHITMRLTVLRQFVKGIRAQAEAKDTKKGRKRMQEEEGIIPGPDELERIKWYLWHGNATDALRLIDEMENDLEWVEEPSTFIQKLLQAVHEFKVYITTNQSFLVNYGDRYRNGEPFQPPLSNQPSTKSSASGL